MFTSALCCGSTSTMEAGIFRVTDPVVFGNTYSPCPTLLNRIQPSATHVRLMCGQGVISASGVRSACDWPGARVAIGRRTIWLRPEGPGQRAKDELGLSGSPYITAKASRA
jgi:hypothetical protein